jgi:hypothetical protein
MDVIKKATMVGIAILGITRDTGSFNIINLRAS